MENNETKVSMNELIEDIKSGVSKKIASQKDESRVMRAMLNDPDYKVDVYAKSGKIGEYCPYEDSRKMVSNIIQESTKITKDESQQLANQYQFSKSDSEVMINISKEFTNTYLQTGRKLPLGGRETIDASLLINHVTKETVKQCPAIVIDKDGSTIKTKTFTKIPPHDSIRVSSPCPDWIKNK